MKDTGKGPALLRLNNEKRVMTALRHQRVTSRQDLSRTLALSKNTVSLIIDDLIAAGRVKERGAVTSSGAGRRKIEIALLPETLQTAGIMVERQQVHVRVCDYFSRVLEAKSWQTQTQVPGQLLAELARYCQQLAQARPELLGIALGFPGIIDPQRGWMHHSSHLGWSETDLLTPLQAGIALPLLTMNSVKAAALLSVQQLRLDPSDNCFYLRIAEGVGGALVRGGSVYTGSSWTAGEVGHLTIEPQGPCCTCGRDGCLETLISIPAVQRQFAERVPGLSWENQACAPEVVDALMAQVGNWLGIALGQIMLLLNPANIVVDAPWSHHPHFVAAAQQRAQSSALGFTAQHTRLHFLQERIDPVTGLALAIVERYESPVG